MREIKCEQCGKLIEEGQEVKRMIRVNHGERLEVFCSSQCAAHYQMGCEG